MEVLVFGCEGGNRRKARISVVVKGAGVEFTDGDSLASASLRPLQRTPQNLSAETKTDGCRAEQYCQDD